MLWLFIPLCIGLTTVLFIIMLTPFAERVGLLDKPDYRKKHEKPVPMVGGVAIYLVVFGAMLVSDPPEKVVWVTLTGTMILITGVLDDVFGLGVKVRLMVQTLATAVVIFNTDLWVSSIGIDWIDTEILGKTFGIFTTIFAVVGLTNAFNMADGLDGLASGHILVSIGSVVTYLFMVHGEIHQWESVLVLFSAVFGFWLVNLSLTPLAKIFLGDAGSLLLGFLMSWVLIYYSQEPVNLIQPMAVIWCVSIPVFDTIIVILRRLKNKTSPFSADRNHLHHYLVDMGVRPRQALVMILLAACFVNGFGLLITNTWSPSFSALVWLVCLCLYACCILYPEFVKRLLNEWRRSNR